MKSTRKKKSSLLVRAIKVQPGLALSVLGLAVVLGGVYVGADATSSTTTTACKPYSVSDINAAQPARNQVAYTFKSEGQGKRSTAAVKAGSDCDGYIISLVSYQTPARNGQPLTAQTIFDSQTKVTTMGVTTFDISIPSCYYQLDLVYGHPIDLRTGLTYHGRDSFLTGVLGGENTCVAGPGTTRTPTPSATPHTTPHPTATPRPTPSPTATPTPTPNPTVNPTPTPTPQATNTPAPTASPTPTPVVTTVDNGTPRDEAPIVTAPGESVLPASTTAALTAFLPQTGKAGQLMTIIGALFITGGLIHLWLTQRHKLLLGGKRK